MEDASSQVTPPAFLTDMQKMCHNNHNNHEFPTEHRAIHHTYITFHKQSINIYKKIINIHNISIKFRKYT